MNVWIASDIHGSALYCRKLLDLMEKRGADRMAPGTTCRRDTIPRRSLPC